MSDSNPAPQSPVRQSPVRQSPVSWNSRQYSAPSADREVLCEPSDGDVRSLIDRTQSTLDSVDCCLCDEPLSRVRTQARQEILAEAARYTEQVRGVPVPPPGEGPLVVTGHQPELYHPGVWLKNFAASKISGAIGGLALNVIVDTDLCDELAIPVLDQANERPKFRTVAIDEPDRQSPWEDLRIKSPAILPAAGEQIRRTMSQWDIEPIAADHWFDAPQVQTGDCLVEHLTRLRHNRQQAWDAPLLELPMRRLCRLPSYALFVCHVLRNIDRLQAVYNEGLATYRRLNGLRSAGHPMPDLGAVTVDGRQRREAPLWVWRAGDVKRRPIWIEQLGCSFRLYDVRDDDHENAECVGVIRRTDCAADAWHKLLIDLDQQGIRIRPRALMTTLFLRLCVADLFIHGIGGAKYDEVTDHLFREFVGSEAPGFLTISGTLRLPIPRHTASAADETRLKSLLWDLRHNADRHGIGADELIARKRQLVAEQQAAEADAAAGRPRSPRENYDRFTALKAVADELAERASRQIESVATELATVRHQLAENKLLASREFSWVLYPEDLLREWLHEASDRITASVTQRPVETS